jgi:UDP-N-acetylglucosamine 2-epimerase (non-hydrolysing)
MKHIVHLVAGARPNVMKIAPLYHALVNTSWCEPRVIHTGQHTTPAMIDDVLAQFRVPVHAHLRATGATPHEQVGNTLAAYAELLRAEKPAVAVVPGDVSASLGCALAAVERRVPIAHLEAGLRSGDMTMPEEANRRAIDALSTLRWAPSPDAVSNLNREGWWTDQIDMVGNVMIDALRMQFPRLRELRAARQPSSLVVATLHRPSNVDDYDRLVEILAALARVATRLPVYLVVHPRLQRRIDEFGLGGMLVHFRVMGPLSYRAFMLWASDSTAVITDSGGVQEETTYLNVPCLTLRENTERPVTIKHGTNRLVTPETLLANVDRVLAGDWPKARPILGWDGHAADRVVDSLIRFLGVTPSLRPPDRCSLPR